MPKRNERVAPPRAPGGYEVRYLRTEAVKGWEDLCSQAPSAAWEVFHVMATKPCDPENPQRQHRLRGKLDSIEVKGALLEQWQYEVTGGGRVWYAVNSSERVVWISYASTRHPKATE